MPERVKFYTDEHVPKAIIRSLRKRGVDVLTVPEANMIGASDVAHLARALNESRVIFTKDADVLRLHASGVDHAGIAYANRRASLNDIVNGLMLIYQILDADDMKGRVEFL